MSRVLVHRQRRLRPDQRFHKPGGMDQQKTHMRVGDGNLRARSSAGIRTGTSRSLPVFSHLPGSLETEKSVPALDSGSPLDAPGNDIPPFTMIFQGLQKFQIFGFRPGIAAYQIHVQ